MAELLPLAQAETIKTSLLDYLGTTFALADPDARAVLDAFLQDRDTGMFRGPYVRTRLPFRPADDGWREHLEWYEGFTPYGHQAAAFARLSSYDLGADKPRPQPTLVTTGTGSGKTEAFLYPILDHVRRAKREGQTGTKALILYPMNALANDQAQRLAEMITGHSALGGITAALYTGQAGPQRTTVSRDGLITSREVIRDTAPDILLTNYKMLDQLLLRPADADLWKQSAVSLQYLVLDEFHTYDGAQGTDVSMLLRRLGQTLKSHWPTDDAEAERAGLTPADRERPLGRITPVATSATLGDKGDPSAMLGFAETVFGEPFPPQAVITESRLSLDEWADGATERADRAGYYSVPASGDPANLVNALRPDSGPAETTATVLHWLYTGELEAIRAAVDSGDDVVLDLVKAHPLFHRVLDASRSAVTLDELAAAVAGFSSPTESDAAATAGTRTEGEHGATPRRADATTLAATEAVLTALSHVRATAGRAAPSVDVHLWIRELTRINRAASGDPLLAWHDDGVRLASDSAGTAEVDAPYYPAVYCRHCNRSGWGVVLAPTGSGLDTADPQVIRRAAAQRNERFRALIHAPAEAADAEDHGVDALPTGPDPTLAWFLVSEEYLTPTRPDEALRAEGGAIPVIVDLTDDAGERSRKQTCPSCLQDDGIRFLGSAIATMLSVSLSTLFGTPGLDRREKRALVFTDSVQDAAHRAGFVQARSHALTLRTLLRQALDAGETDLESLAHSVLDLAGDDPGARYRILPPELAERGDFEKFWTTPTARRIPNRLRRFVLRRLLLDIQLEFGLRAGVGRTLERTGTAVAYVDAGEALLLAAARSAVDSPDVQLTLDAPGTQASISTPGAQIALDSPDGAGALAGFDDARLARWVRGVLVHMRRRGAIEHLWFDKFRSEAGNRWWITGGRRRAEGMPGFGRGSSAPGYPILASPGRDSDLEPVTSPRGWYARWTAQTLGVTNNEGAVLARLLFTELHRRDVLGQVGSDAGAPTFHLPATTVIARPLSDAELADAPTALRCTICRDTVHSAPTVIRALAGGPCMVVHCDGTLQSHSVEDNFYRQMYASTDITRVVAREHTSLLPDKTRLEYEDRFKQADPPPNAPNVLVATPTLEMGIDIGDLSAVMLSSLPKTVANYLQRIGRAGRLTGNALALAYVTGRGDQLARLNRPGDTINGTVRPPATYLDAEEILRRQFIASLADILARRPDSPQPRTTPDALGSTAPQSYLGHLISLAEGNADELTEAFLAAFPPLREEVAARLRAFPRPGDAPGTSELARRCHMAVADFRRRIEMLTRRKAAVQKVLPELQRKAESPASTSEDENDLRTAKATRMLLDRQLSELRSEYWISALEAFGLLPNYTLLDDTVDLSVSVRWRDPESDSFEHDEFEISRGAAQALRDFAPGSTFYTHGYAIDIDAVDLGADGEEVHTWACCGGCGFTVDLSAAATPDGDAAAGTGGNPPGGTATPPGQCPRCGSATIGDVGQQLPVVELRNVSAIIRRDEAAIDDTNDERIRRSFRVVTAADVDPGAVTKRWFVDPLGLGATHLRGMRLRWLNLGIAGGGGSTRAIAGQKVDAALFRVCSECGKLDRDTGANRPSEHRPWCSLRTAMTEDTRSVALTRTLTTEGLVLRLPQSVTLGDTFALPSLSAALLLGLREQIGGAPDHLHVAQIVDPSVEGADRPALLVHDIVPGGTGYLADLTDPATVWDLLRRAWDAVRSCPCAEEGKLACERCLLPFAPPGEADYTSRSAAARHLATLLTGQEIPVGDDADVVIPESMPWHVTAEEPEADDDESDLEKRFRVAFRERLEALGATITEKPTDRGVAWDIALNQSNRWTMRPQENVLGSKPDFMLDSRRPGVPRTAIFTDGYTFHATAKYNRVADDAEKRRNLRDAGYQVLGLTRADIDGEPPIIDAVDDNARAAILRSAGDGLSKSALDLAFAGGLDLLVAWVQNPAVARREGLARWAPLLAIAANARTATRTDTDSTAEAALAAVDSTVERRAKGEVIAWRSGTLGTAVRMPPGSTVPTEFAVVLDDDEAALTSDAKESWRRWLHWANLLSFRDLGLTVTTRHHMASASMTVGRTGPDPGFHTPPEGTVIELTGDWLAASQDADPDDQPLIAQMATAGLPLPEIGAEAAGGIPLEISWPQVKVFVDSPGTDLDAEERAELASGGWTVCSPTVESVRATLEQKGG